MKKTLIILSLVLCASLRVMAQDEEPEAGGGEKIRDKMNEYIQKRLDVSSDEARKFTPIFLRYFREWRQTMRQYRDDRLLRQQKIIELRLRFRPEFRDILGEKRANMVYDSQERFIQEIKNLEERRMGRDRPRVLRGPNKSFSLRE